MKMEKNFVIDYYVVLNSGTLYNKQIKVKNKDNELMAKCSLEDYLKRKYGNTFKQLVITKCEEDIISMFNSFFGGFK